MYSETSPTLHRANCLDTTAAPTKYWKMSCWNASDAYTHQCAKATAQVVLTEDKRPTVYNNLHNLHTPILSTITGSAETIFTGDIMEDDDTL